MPLRRFVAIVFAIIILLISGIVWYAVSLNPETNVSPGMTTLAALWALAIVATVAMGLLLDHAIIRPLISLKDKATSIGDGDFNVLAQHPGPLEVCELQDVFNQMVKGLSERERGIHDREQRFSSLFQRIPDAVFVFDMDSLALEEANQAALDLFGYTHDEFVAHRLLELSAEPEETGKALAAFNEGKLSVPVSRIFRKKDGSTFPSEIYPSLYMQDERRKCVTVVQDTTKRNSMQSELLQSVQRLKELDFIISQSPVVVFLWRAEENWPVEYVSENIRHFGYTPDDFYSGRVPYASIVHAEDLSRVGDEVTSFSQDPACNGFAQEYRILSPEGRVFTIDDRTWIRHNEKGEITHYQGIILDITDRKQAEDDLRSSRDVLKSIIENIPVRIFWKDEQLNYLGCNTLFAHDAGKSAPEDLLGKDDFQMGWREQAELYRADDQKVVDADTPILSYEEPQTTPDGSKIWLRTSKVPLHRGDGTVSGVLGIYEDITKHKQAELALKESELRFRSIFDEALDGILLTDAETRTFTMANPALCEMLGYTAEEIKTLGVGDIHPPEDLPMVTRFFEQQLAGREKLAEDIPVLRKDGSVFYADINSVPVTLEGRTYLMGVFRDTTARREAEAKLQETLQKLDLFRRTVDQSSDMIFVTDTETGLFIDVNETACVRLGYTRAELLNLGPKDIETDFPKTFSWHRAVKHLRTVSSETTQGRTICKDGTAFPVEVSIKYVALEHRDVIIAITRDISERVETERALRYAQKIDALGNLAGGIAHNMNNLLLPIMTLTSMTLKDLPEDSRARKRLEKVVEATVEGKALVQQIMDFSRRNTEEGQRVARDLRHAVKEALDLVMVSVPSSIDVREDLGDCELRVEIDQGQFTTMIMNVVSNAVDAFEGKVGRMTISLAPEHVNEAMSARVQNLRPGDYAKLIISDTGRGMDEQTLERVFDPFFTTKAVDEGNGLGLSTVLGVVEKHQGAVMVSSAPGQGSTVTIYLPILDGAEEEV